MIRELLTVFLIGLGLGIIAGIIIQIYHEALKE